MERFPFSEQQIFEANIRKINNNKLRIQKRKRDQKLHWYEYNDEVEQNIYSYEFLDFINIKKIVTNPLCYNKNSITYLKKRDWGIDWVQISSNPNAMSLLEQNKEKIVWKSLSCNENAIHL